jgi:cytochrome P450
VRAKGTLVPTRRGSWVSPNHRVCDSILRSRSFGAIGRDTDEAPFDLSFIMMNPPDHTRLRRIVVAGFSQRSLKGY